VTQWFIERLVSSRFFSSSGALLFALKDHVPMRTRIPKVVATVTAALLIPAVAIFPVSASASSKSKPTSSFAGYSSTLTGVNSFDATIGVPSFTCTKSSDAAAVVMQVGADSFLVILHCVKHHHELVPTFEVVLTTSEEQTDPPFSMGGGDTVTLSIQCSESESTLVIDDQTTGSTATLSPSDPTTCEDPRIGVSSFGGTARKLAPLPGFGAIDFSNVTVNGAPFLDSLINPGYQETNAYWGKNEITTGSWTDDGQAFTTTQGK
jgi:hypothetical protein